MMPLEKGWVKSWYKLIRVKCSCSTDIPLADHNCGVMSRNLIPITLGLVQGRFMYLLALDQGKFASEEPFSACLPNLVPFRFGMYFCPFSNTDKNGKFFVSCFFCMSMFQFGVLPREPYKPINCTILRHRSLWGRGTALQIPQMFENSGEQAIFQGRLTNVDQDDKWKIFKQKRAVPSPPPKKKTPGPTSMA